MSSFIKEEAKGKEIINWTHKKLIEAAIGVFLIAAAGTGIYFFLSSGTLPNKPILCTFGKYTSEFTVGPEDGLCDIIILDYFYSIEMGTFLDSTKLVLRWFLRYASKMTAITQYGIGIDKSNALQPYNDLYDAVGVKTFRDFWNLNIRHYGLLNFQVHNALVTNRSTVQDYGKLLKRLRELQEVNRAEAIDKFGYIILGVGLFGPKRGNAYNYLKELLQTAPIDAVVIKTHTDEESFGRTYKITGPNVYLRSWNEFEVSMVEALDYVQSQQAYFNHRPLMVSFTMATLLFSVPETTLSDHYQLGELCEYRSIVSIYTVCQHNALYSFTVVPDAYVMLGFQFKPAQSISYDSPTTIIWKICSSTKRYPDLQFGVALFNLNLEDGTHKLCLREDHMKEAAGYWRTAGVSSYMKSVVRDPDILNNTSC